MQRYELSMGVLTVKTNQDWDRDFLICRDELLKTVNISLTVETKFWIFLVEIFKIKTFSVHAKIFVEIVKICWEKLRLSRFVKKSWINQGFLSLKMTKSLNVLRNLNKKYAKIHLLLNQDQNKLLRNDKISSSWWTSQSWSRLLCLDIDVKTKLRSLDLNWDFSTVEMNFLTMSRFPQLSRQTFWQFRDQESWSRHDQDKSRPQSLLWV